MSALPERMIVIEMLTASIRMKNTFVPVNKATSMKAQISCENPEEFADYVCFFSYSIVSIIGAIVLFKTNQCVVFRMRILNFASTIANNLLFRNFEKLKLLKFLSAKLN